MLRIAEQWYGSDVGRQRQGNEDNFFVRAPVFVVADGMGGAQAGEVASAMAVEEFEPEMPNGVAPEESLAEIIRTANNKIHEMSRSNTQRSGMGTTCTAIYVDENEVVLAHVGDSRCYLYRDGDLTRLTRDHSLVGELVDRGKITEEQAEMHPQRSVITRALGPEYDVKVDTERVEARDGDVFLLCSDGLTSMVREAGLLPVFEHSSSLEETGRGLIAAANEAGGRDNITVILIRLETIDVPEGMTQATTESTAVDGDDDGYDTFSGPAVGAEPRQGVTRMSIEQATRAAEGAPAEEAAAPVAPASDSMEAAYKEDFATTALPAIPRPAAPDEPPPPPEDLPPLAEDAPVADEPPPPEPPAPAPPPPVPASAPPPPVPGVTRTGPSTLTGAPPKQRKKRRWRRILIPLIILAILGSAAYAATRAVFFVGLDDDKAVTVFRGLPYDLPAGIKLYSRDYTSGVTIDQVPASRRKTYIDHKLRSRDDVNGLIKDLENGKIQP
jgi:protein phosphatase